MSQRTRDDDDTHVIRPDTVHSESPFDPRGGNQNEEEKRGGDRVRVGEGGGEGKGWALGGRFVGGRCWEGRQ